MSYRRYYLIIFLIGTLGVAIAATIPFLFGFSEEPSDPNPPGSTASSTPVPADQAFFQARIVDDRKQLFAGILTFRSHASTDVDDTVTYAITLLALGEQDSRSSQAHPVGTETRKFQVGGIEGASLTPDSSGVEVKPLADTKTKQVIAQPGDIIRWQWTVAANEPGNYDLVLELTTYQGDSERALATLTPPITIHLSVHNTFSHRVSSMRNGLIAWGGVAMALAALFAFRTPLISFVRSKNEARQEKRSRGQDGYM
ncbi:hypothetical protein ABZ848_13840 [Streptomyces sp. NPDC047081]|uniref:hypothetical protein n=1 Tax=Streptomyces sp. NPDC047081 TaxID=3154706 RepID=UPI0033C562B9